MNTALVVIDIQNDITKHYKDIINKVNQAIDWAIQNNMYIIYIKHNNISEGTLTFKYGTKGSEFVPELKVVTENIFTKTKSSAMTSEEFIQFISKNNINKFYVCGADATACVKSTCFNMRKANYIVSVISDCVTSYNPDKINEMLDYYKRQGCEVKLLSEYIND